MIRNSKSIFDYSKKFVSVNARNKIELGHDFDGDEVKRETYSGGEQPQLSCLRQALQSLFAEGYSDRDIAVLYGKESLIPRNLCSKLNFSRIVDAEKNNSEHLVVSTLRMYSGLERPVVLLVNLDESLPLNSPHDSSIYSAITRAMVKLVVIERE